MASQLYWMFTVDGLAAIAGLGSQWIGAHYARAHGLDSWPFGFVPFMCAAVIAFLATGIFAVVKCPSRRDRIVIVSSRIVLLGLCAYFGLFLWLNIYGS